MTAIAYSDIATDIGYDSLFKARNIRPQESRLGVDELPHHALGACLVCGVIVHVQRPVIGDVLPEDKSPGSLDRAHVERRVTDIGVAINPRARQARPVEVRGNVAGRPGSGNELRQRGIVFAFLVGGELRKIDPAHDPQQRAGNGSVLSVPGDRRRLRAAAAHERRACPRHHLSGSGGVYENLAPDRLPARGILDKHLGDRVVIDAAFHHRVHERRPVQRSYAGLFQHPNHDASGPFGVEGAPGESTPRLEARLVMRQRIARPVRKGRFGYRVDAPGLGEALHQFAMDAAGAGPGGTLQT